jgi:hypothetical protein
MPKIYIQKLPIDFHKEVEDAAFIISTTPSDDPTKPVVVTKSAPPIISVYVDLTPDYFEIKMSYQKVTPSTVEGEQPTTETCYLVWHKIMLSILTQEQGIADQTAWSYAYSSSVEYPDATPVIGKVKWNEDPTPKAYELLTTDLIDLFGVTYNTKPSFLLNRTHPSFKSVYNIFVPFVKNATMLDFEYRIKTQDGLVYEIDPTSPSKDILTFSNDQVKDSIASITLNGPDTLSPDSSGEVTVTTLPQIDAIYIETVHGQVNPLKVKLTNGVGKFNAITTGMISGDVFEAKVGFKKWTNKIRYTKTVS